ncbi:polar amino acid transport system substrate-binding protein [Burkholderia sp. D7]|nr:polar amino acid transport system substrate-binding protein [Burkholderia sp. D7]
MTRTHRTFAKFVWPACLLTLVALRAAPVYPQASATLDTPAHTPLSCVAAASGAGTKDEQANKTVAALFAPTGTLRASINLGNPVLASLDPSTGRAVGVSVDLATEFARQLGVPLELVVVKSAGQSVINVDNDQADIGFFAVDPKRGEEIAFTKPYVQIEGFYLVRDGSPIKSNEQVDQAGNTVAVGKGSAYDLFLTRELHHAKIVRVNTSPAVVQAFLDQNLTVAAGVKQQLEENARQTSGLRILDQRFMVIRQVMGVPKSRGDAAAAYLTSFVECMKASGFVAGSLARHNIKGAEVPAMDHS